MPIRNIASFAVAIALGLLAMVLVRNYLGRAQTQPGATAGVQVGTTPVVVAAAPIARGATLETAKLKIVRYPSASVPDGAFTDLAQLSGTGANARVALRALVAGEPLLTVKISAPGGKGNLSGTLREGMRAIGLRSNDVTGVGGFVLPGDRVDVLVTRQLNQNDSVTQVLAQNVRVLGVDQTDDQDADKPQVAKAVTVEVTPEEAQAISLAQSVGTVSLSLRQIADEAPVARKSLSTAELGGAKVAPVQRDVPKRRQPTQVVPVSAPVHKVQVTRGMETAQYSVGVE